MCWNATVSLNTFLIGLFAITLSIINKTHPWYFLLFFMSFILMQLIEFFIWTFYDNRKLNSYFTFAGLILVLLQPIAASFLLYKDHRLMMKYLLVAYLIFALIGLLFIIPDKPIVDVVYSRVGKDGHLIWSWIDTITTYLLTVYTIFFFIPLYFSGNKWIFVLAAVTLLFSLYFYHKNRTWGSMWCWTANIVSIIIIIKIIFLNGPLCKIK